MNNKGNNKNIALIFFSGTGNTKAIAKLLSNELRNEIPVNVIKVDDLLKQKKSFDITNYDMIGLGYPIHGFDAPQIIYDFVKNLPEVKNKDAFIFFTCAGPLYLNSNSTLLLKRKLRKKGFNVFYERIFYMPANILTPYNDEVCKQLYNAAIPKTKQMANDIINRKKRIRNDPFIVRILLFWLYILEKVSWKPLAKDFKVKKTCNLCMKCVNTCPKENITLKNNKIKFKWNCMGCYRCVYSCPENAITGRLFKLVIIKNGYNIQKIIENDELKGDFITSKTKGYYRIFNKYLTDVDV